MPISGLMLTLADDASLAGEALGAIAGERRIEVGDREQHRLAVVVDTRTREEDQQLWRWLNDLPGVRFVDVVYVTFEDGSPGRQSAPGAEEAAT